MDEKWRGRMPVRVGEASLRGLHEHLLAKHECVEVVVQDATGIHEKDAATIDRIVNGHLWVGVCLIMFRCERPALQVVVQDNPLAPVEMLWAPESRLSAQVVRQMVRGWTAPTQLLCRTGWAMFVPLLVWFILQRTGIFANQGTGSAAPSSAPRVHSLTQPDGTVSRVTTPGIDSFVVPALVGIALGVVATFVLPRLSWIALVFDHLRDWYRRLYPAAYFDFKWTIQSSNEGRWVGICVYCSAMAWLFSTLGH